MTHKKNATLKSLARKKAGSMMIGSLLLATLAGCSATSLRCGVDGEASFVEVYNVPQAFSQNTRAYAELCGFAYEGGE